MHSDVYHGMICWTQGAYFTAKLSPNRWSLVYLNYIVPTLQDVRMLLVGCIYPNSQDLRRQCDSQSSAVDHLWSAIYEIVT